MAALVATVLLLASCSPERGGSEDEDRDWHPRTSVSLACDGIIEREPGVEVKSKLNRAEIYERKPEDEISAAGRESIGDSTNSNLSSICKIYRGVGEENSAIRIDFRRMGNPPPIGSPSREKGKAYLMGSSTIVREKGEYMTLDSLCRLPALTDEAGEENSVHLFMVDDLGLSTRTRALILASAAEKVSSGMGCVNDFHYGENPELEEVSGK
jgi:hypothetical protein